MWFYTRAGEAIETLTCLTTGAQVIRSGEGDRPLEQDEMKLVANNGERHFEAICDALLDKGDLAGYSRAA